MSEQEKSTKTKERCDLVINPDYLQQLKLIQAAMKIPTFNGLLQIILSSKSLQRDTLKKMESNIRHHLSKCITQAIQNFITLQDRAMSGTVPVAYKELEELRSKVKANHIEDCVEVFISQTSALTENVEALITKKTISGMDTSKNATVMKESLSEIDIHKNLKGSKANVCLRLNKPIYNKYFKKNLNRHDPYNRRAFKNAIEENLAFSVSTIEPATYEYIMSELTILDEYNHRLNEAILKGQSTGVMDLMKTFVEAKTKVGKSIKNTEVKNGNGS